MSQSKFFHYVLRGALLLLLSVFQQSASIAQTKTVTGTVTDADGAPLPGASVQIKGSKLAVGADDKGFFSLQVNSDKVVIVISMSGYTEKTMEATAGDPVKVALERRLKDLDEVVVIGYGQQKRENVIGSVSQISGEQLRQAPAMNVTNMLAGRLPGLTTLQQSGRPGADNASLRIRGIGTYNGNTAPLVVVDNVVRDAGFANMDPSEIETISILKDAVSMAVYGVQGANGVILITTKRGKNQRPQVSYDGAVTMNSNTRFPKFLDGPDYMTWYNKGIEMDNEYNMNVGVDPVPLLYSQELIDAVRNGTNTNPLFGNTDWVGKLVGRNSYSQQHSVTVRGGTDKMKYFTSASMLDQDGIVQNTGFKRYNVRTNIDAELNKVFSIAVDLSARQTNGRTPGLSPDNTAYMNPFYQAVRMLPNLPMYDAATGLPTAYRSNASWVNPIASVEKSGFQKTQNNLFQGNITFKVKVPWVEGLELKLMTAYDKSGTENKSWLTPYTLMGRDREQISGSFVTVTTLPGITKNTVRQSYSTYNRKTFQPSISYTREFGDHQITALALYEWSQRFSSVFSAGASNLFLTDLKDINYGSAEEDDWIKPTGSQSIEDSRDGYVVRANYMYKGKYLAEFATRLDGSINFAPKNRYETFPSVGLGWIVSKESFMDDLSNTVSYLKLKASRGKLGNEGTSQFSYLKTFSLTTSPVVVIGGQPKTALYTNAPPDLNLDWETATITNAGFESILWDGLLAVDFEWFYKLTRNILDAASGNYPPSMGGYQPTVVNYGMVSNKGFDLQIRHTSHIGQFQYGLTGNLNWSKNKILRRMESSGLPEWQRTIGRSIGGKMGFVADGIYQTWEEARNGFSPSAGVVAPGFFKFRDLNGDGRLTRADDRTFIGRSNFPELMFGLNIDLHYKGFDFTALIQGAALCDVSLAGTYEGSSGTSGVDDNTPFTKTFYGYGNSPYFLVEDSWTPENPGAKYPRLTAYKATLSPHNANANSGWIRDGSYVRLKAAQLGYTLPQRWLNTVKVRQIRFYVSGFNLLTFDKLKYLDPEMPNVNNGFYPQQRMVSGGVNLTF